MLYHCHYSWCCAGYTTYFILLYSLYGICHHLFCSATYRYFTGACWHFSDSDGTSSHHVQYCRIRSRSPRPLHWQGRRLSCSHLQTWWVCMKWVLCYLIWEWLWIMLELDSRNIVDILREAIVNRLNFTAFLSSCIFNTQEPDIPQKLQQLTTSWVC